MPKKIIAIKTKEAFDGEVLFRKLKKFGFRFEGSRDSEVNSVAMSQHWAAGPYFYLFFSQEAERQWSMYPGNNFQQGLDIDPGIYNARITTTELLSKEDVEFLQME